MSANATLGVMFIEELINSEFEYFVIRTCIVIKKKHGEKKKTFYVLEFEKISAYRIFLNYHPWRLAKKNKLVKIDKNWYSASVSAFIAEIAIRISNSEKSLEAQTLGKNTNEVYFTTMHMAVNFPGSDS